MNKSKTRIAACVVTLAAGLMISVLPAAAAAPVKIVVLGDSLSAGLGLLPGEAFPEQLDAALKSRGHDVTVANAGVSGDTAADGLARLDWSVPTDTDVVIVELGANDALRGIDPASTRKALATIVSTLKGRGQAVLLTGMFAPPNMGAAYGAMFNAIYPDLATEYDVPLYPFFLAGVVIDATLNQADGMHPTAAGVAKIVGSILPDVEKAVAARAAD